MNWTGLCDRIERHTAENVPEQTTKIPPTPSRVARRTMALAAVGARALLEQEESTDPGVEQTRQRLLKWVEAIGVGDELEPNEWKVIQLPLRAIPPKDALNASWRIDGLAVLAWALNHFELPAHDVLADPGHLLPSVGLLDIVGVRLIDDDLALGETPIHSAPRDRFQTALSTALERHLAANWLRGDSARYSDTDTST
jgi:hypothetical protein